MAESAIPPVTSGIFPWDDQKDYDVWLNDLVSNTPESWDGDGSQESIITEYLHELERRVLALGGSLERCESECSCPLIDTSVQPSEPSFARGSPAGCPVHGVEWDAKIAEARRKAREA